MTAIIGSKARGLAVVGAFAASLALGACEIEEGEQQPGQPAQPPGQQQPGQQPPAQPPQQ